ncbi:preprotein translocase subunit SecA [Vibrio sp. DW001]|uniref:preprotein translocase subunit SecA n=1 Tax=Vibrio sp. DW001 TaxID=2912315 RepID=UPI0023B0FFC9|nr:preprotein translocase subunit SecA [Vibrio sp. DW001]WED29093.1 preprotein translocase subunit SecA [Vibrio sp. DW001]
MYKRPQRMPATVLDRPQKTIVQQLLMVRWWRKLTSFFTRPIRSSVLIYRPLMWRINRSKNRLLMLSEEQLTEEIVDAKLALRKYGLTNALVVKSFALIREVAGRELGMWHFDSQVLGGLAILHGNIGQMQTGEGKTLTATLPVATAALAGIPTHLVTVNDYLTARDAELMLPVYTRLGLSVGVIVQNLTVDERKQQYACDIVYCTNNELAFDYLKDSIQLKGKTEALHLHAVRIQPNRKEKPLNQLMLRGLHFAVVDEADGVLLDEANTPLIISGEEVPQEAQQQVYSQAMGLIASLKQGEHYKVLKQQRQIEMTTTGEKFTLQLTQDLGPLWKGRVRRLELLRQALTAWHLFEKDKHYLIHDEKIVIIDEHTGRMMPDRTWERGLHQLIEIKEGCELSAPRETLASVSFQNFFRYYHHLSGMTGTAEEVKSELWQVYELPVVDVPTHKTNQRKLIQRKVYFDDHAKWLAISERVTELKAQLRPVLVGTQSLAASEYLSDILTGEGIEHQVLNARQDEQEAEIVAQAGDAGKVTIATSMAGRGTDIKLSEEVDVQGGLHVIITGLHDSSRVDRQLRGRCARQGDKGSYEFMLSLEDNVLSDRWASVLRKTVYLPIPQRLKNRLMLFGIRVCQRRIERDHERVRKALLRSDESKQDLLSFTNKRM